MQDLSLPKETLLLLALLGGLIGGLYWILYGPDSFIASAAKFSHADYVTFKDARHRGRLKDWKQITDEKLAFEQKVFQSNTERARHLRAINYLMQANQNRAKGLLREEKYGEAELYFNNSIALESEALGGERGVRSLSPSNFGYIGMMRERQGNSAGARQAYDSAVSMMHNEYEPKKALIDLFTSYSNDVK